MRGINQREGTRVTVSIEENRESFNQMREKFYKEAQRLAELEEPHIVEVTDFFEDNQTAYYVMKLINGESLAATMKRTGKPFSEAEVRQILPQVLNALKCVHQQGIYHLDLKPGNIMRDTKGHCWLIDFGASKQLSSNDNKTLSTSMGLSYTPGYAPSEQVSGNMNRIGAWTDFYALGATLYNLLSSQTPPEPDDVRYDGERAFHFPSALSNHMRQLVIWLMQPDYPRRPQTVADIMVRLEHAKKAEKKTQPRIATSLKPSVPIVENDAEENGTILLGGNGTILLPKTPRSSSAETVRSKQNKTVLPVKKKGRKSWYLFNKVGVSILVAIFGIIFGLLLVRMLLLLAKVSL